MDTLSKNARIKGGLIGLIIGDALGVPVEFKSRLFFEKNPLMSMRGYGTHNQPPGTWSDDSSLMLCTMEALINDDALSTIANKFMMWYYNKLWTPYGEVFDIGRSTARAIRRLWSGVDPENSGCISEGSQGNGSLMRILPASLFFLPLVA